MFYSSIYVRTRYLNFLINAINCLNLLSVKSRKMYTVSKQLLQLIESWMLQWYNGLRRNSNTWNIQTKVYLHYHAEDNAPMFFRAPTKPLSLDLRPLEIVHIDLDGQVLWFQKDALWFGHKLPMQLSEIAIYTVFIINLWIRVFWLIIEFRKM